MKRSLATSVLLAAIGLPSLALAADRCGAAPDTPPARQKALSVVALGEQNGAQALFCLNERNSQRARHLAYLGALDTDSRIVGIDFRVQDGLLYGVGDAGGLYQIDRDSGAAMLVGRLTVPFDASASVSMDFNPAANALRIVTSSGQNLRQPFANLGTGSPLAPTLADAPLSLAGVSGAAYTNNDLDTGSGTTLFDLSAASDQVLIQSPPNNGNVVATGSFGVDAATVTGFDIHSTVRDGKTVANRGLAMLRTADGLSGLFDVNLLTGQLTQLGETGAALMIRDIAIPLAQD